MSTANDDENIYEGHPALTPVQAQVLNEYAKLNRSLKSVRETPTIKPSPRPPSPPSTRA